MPVPTRHSLIFDCYMLFSVYDIATPSCEQIDKDRCISRRVHNAKEQYHNNCVLNTILVTGIIIYTA